METEQAPVGDRCGDASGAPGRVGGARFLPAWTKRAFDIVVATAALVILSPLLVVLAVLVRVQLGAPVLFRQVRPGLHGRPFTIYKFRTMLDAEDEHGQALPDEERLTAFGHMLRSTSLDELPELVNVLKGDMSLVGPRPLIMAYVARYTPEQARRMEVRPGITGLAQVAGRNAISWDERFRLDVEYVDTWSLALDVAILWRTFRTVLAREGINAEGHATMPEFMGPEHDATSWSVSRARSDESEGQPGTRG